MKSALGLLLLFSAQPASPSPQPERNVPRSTLTQAEQEKAALVVSNDCMICHSEEMLAQQRLTEKQWEAVLKKMQSWGSPLEPENADLAARYLSARYGLDAPPHALAMIDSGDVAKAVAPLPDGPYKGGTTKEGKQIYDAMCMACHGSSGEGGQLGVALSGRPILFRAPDFARVVRSGRARMPAHAGIGNIGIASVISYLRSLAQDQGR